MRELFQIVALVGIISVFGGEFLIFFLKKYFLNPRSVFTFELSGMIERASIITAFVLGGLFFAAIPAMIIIRGAYVLNKEGLEKLSSLITKEEPALEYQKIKLKFEIIITVSVSPLLGILSGLLVKAL